MIHWINWSKYKVFTQYIIPQVFFSFKQLDLEYIFMCIPHLQHMSNLWYRFKHLILRSQTFKPQSTLKNNYTPQSVLNSTFLSKSREMAQDRKME